MLGPMAGGRVEGMAYRRQEIGDADYLVGVAGTGTPLLLLHGFPQTHYCWRKVVPLLMRETTVVATDLRGYGATSAPPGGPKGQGYSKRELAREVVAVMTALGFERFAVAGHDRGGRVAYRLALDHPDRVDRLAVLNVVPTLDQFERMGAGPTLAYWPWFLFAQPSPFPERLFASAREDLLGYAFDSWAETPGAIDAEAFAVYVEAFDEATIAAACADFRASFWVDRQDALADRESGRRIECPLLAIAGAAETQLADAGEVWRRWSTESRALTVPGGHFIPEEAPAELATALLKLLRA